jgi:hypothetical protein
VDGDRFRYYLVSLVSFNEREKFDLVSDGFEDTSLLKLVVAGLLRSDTCLKKVEDSSPVGDSNR